MNEPMRWVGRVVAGLLVLWAIGASVLDQVRIFAPPDTLVIRWSTDAYRVVDVGLAAVAPGSVNTGDVVDVAALPVTDRYRLAWGWKDGRTIRLTVRAAHGAHDVDVRAVARSPRVGPFWLAIRSIESLFFVTGSALIAAIIMWRRPSVMALYFSYFCTFGPLNRAVGGAALSVLPDSLYRLAIVAVDPIFAALPLVALIPFIARFPSGSFASQRRWVGALVDVGFVVVAIALIALSATVTWPADYHPALHEIPEFAALAVVIAWSIVAYARRTGDDRRRVAVVLAGIGVTAAAYTLNSLFVVGNAIPGQTRALNAVLFFIQSTLPYAVAYAVLRHRIIDIGFALNRATVFATTTGLIVALFGALQWAANGFLERATQTQGFFVQLSIAIVVLFAFRAARDRSESLVSRLLFAQRQRRIEAIARLAGEIDELASANSVAAFTVDRLAAGASIDASVYTEHEGAYLRTAGRTDGPERVALDDPAAVALRARREPVHVGEHDLGGAIAFPLLVRGRLRGALVCALPADDHEFAPDEQLALMNLAAHVAAMVDGVTIERYESELASAQLRLAELEAERIGFARGLAHERDAV